MNPLTSHSVRPASAWGTALSAGLLVALTALVYAAALRGGFLWDDDSHVTANPVVIGPLGLKEIWTTSAANYFPLVLTSYWLQHALWGLNPLGFHAVTLACHMLAALLLWRVLLRLAAPGAWLGAALWALHPVQVESVAWISELKNTQSAVFFLLSIYCFLRWQSGERRYYAGALLCALLALLSKPSTVMLPAVLGLCFWWRRREWRWREAGALAPFFALSLAMAGWTIWEQRHHSGALGAEWSQSFPERLAGAGRAAWFYFGKLVWPEGLTFIYPRWHLALSTVLAWLPLAAMLGGLGLTLQRRDRARGTFIAATYFVVLLFPVLGFFNVYFFRYAFVADHFQYLASIGPLAWAGAAITRLTPRLRYATATVLLLSLSTLTWRHTAVFANNEALWRATLPRNPDAAVAWLNLGATLAKQHRDAEAIACFQRVTALRLDDAAAHADAGWGLLQAGYPEPALPPLERAVQLDPSNGQAHTTLGNALRRLGRHDEAIPHYIRALELQPALPERPNNLGSAWAEAGHLPEAQELFERALRLDPKFAPAHANLGTVHGLAGRWADAVGPLREALRLQPDYPDAHEKLAVALANTGRLAEAAPQFERALVLNSASARLRAGFSEIMQRLGRERDAAEFLHTLPPSR